MNSKADGLTQHFDIREIELTEFDHDITLKGWADLYRVGAIELGPIFRRPIATLTPPRLAGVPGTATNLIQPSVVITDTTGTPYASFDLRDTPARQPGVSVHFLASSYGITTPASYVFSFFVESSASITLQVSGLTLPGITPTGVGSKTSTGKRAIEVVYSNLAPTQPVNVTILQTAGQQWAWYSTDIAYPPLIFDQVVSP
jgi:hypothetical protein